MLSQLAAVTQKAQVFRALRHPNYRWFWLGSSTRSMGQGMQFLIIGWLVLELTDSASQLGLMLIIYGIPNMTLVLFGGLFADRIDRRKLLLVSQAAVTGIIFSLAVLTVTDRVGMWHVYVAIFSLGVLQALNSPARMAIVADLVNPDDLMNAVALNSATMNSGRILGPALAGAIIEVVDIGSALYLNAGFYFLGTLTLLPIKGLSQRGASGKSGMIGDLVAGLRYFWVTPVAFTVIGMGMAFGFFGMPYIQLMPAFAKEVLGLGAAGAGLLLTATGVGSLVGNVGLASLGDTGHKNWILLWSLIVFGVGLICLAISPWLWLSWAILLLVGAGGSIVISVMITILQLTVPGDLQGRVLSLLYVSAGLMFAGSYPMSLVGEHLNWTVAFAGGSGLCLLVVLILGLWLPTLRRLEV
ncbi:MAG: MFS transporter [Dehalococcoidia bacterium]